MKINLRKLGQVEASYNGKRITLNALQSMVEIITYPTDIEEAPSAYKQLAIDTLLDLGIIEDTKVKEVKQLNS